MDSSDDGNVAVARERSWPFRPRRCGAFCPLAIVEHSPILAVHPLFKQTSYSDSILMLNLIEPKRLSTSSLPSLANFYLCCRARQSYTPVLSQSQFRPTRK